MSLLSPLLALVALAGIALPAATMAQVAAPRPESAQAAAPTTISPVQIPNFWDPRARLERPPATGIGTIRFLTADDFPPFSFRDRRGMLIGFDIDLAEAICEVLQVRCAVQTRPFETLV